MGYLFLILCSAVLSCRLVAEENPMERPLLDYNNINAACQSYEAAKAFFGKIDPDAVIQFDSTIGAIEVVGRGWTRFDENKVRLSTPFSFLGF
jgi:hypothetical protein